MNRTTVVIWVCNNKRGRERNGTNQEPLGCGYPEASPFVESHVRSGRSGRSGAARWLRGWHVLSRTKPSSFRSRGCSAFPTITSTCIRCTAGAAPIFQIRLRVHSPFFYVFIDPFQQDQTPIHGFGINICHHGRFPLYRILGDTWGFLSTWHV